MKQKKLKFTFLGLLIFILTGVGWLIKEFEDTTLWVAWMTEIVALIGVYTHYNSKDKKEVLSHEDQLDKDNK